MGTVTGAQLLRAHEAALDEPLPRRGAALVAGCRQTTTEAVSRWSVAERDAALFDLRGELFGWDAHALTSCAACEEQLEVVIDLAALRPLPSAGSMLDWELDGYLVRSRWPNTDDVVHAATGDAAVASVALLERCVETIVSPDGRQLSLAETPYDVGAGIRRHIAGVLEANEAILCLTCDACGAGFDAPFDIAAFVLSDVETWAKRTLRDVHLLASTYGWTEAEIIGLGARRRQQYLDLIEEDRHG